MLRRRRNSLRLLTRQDLDNRTRAARLYDTMRATIISDLGGEAGLSKIELTLADAYCACAVLLDDLTARILSDMQVDPAALNQIINGMTKVASKLGISRRMKDVSMDLKSYLRQKEQEREVEEDDDDDTED